MENELRRCDLTKPVCSPDSGSPGATFSLLYRIAAFAALATVVVTIVQIVLGVLWPPPDFAPTAVAAANILAMAQANPALTFLRLDGLMILDYLLLIVVYTALYAALRRSNPSLMLLATALALIAITLYLASNPAATMLVLARKYSDSGATGSGIVSAAQAVLVDFQGTAFLVHYVAMGIAGMLVARVMLQSDVFSRTTALAGLTQGAMMLVPVTFGTVGLLFALGSLVPFIIWFVLIALRLFRMSASDGHVVA
jgi:Domain of unknown function (DUF4386)